MRHDEEDQFESSSSDGSDSDTSWRSFSPVISDDEYCSDPDDHDEVSNSDSSSDDERSDLQFSQQPAQPLSQTSQEIQHPLTSEEPCKIYYV